MSDSISVKPWSPQGPWVMSEAEQRAIRAAVAPESGVRLAPGEVERIVHAVLKLLYPPVVYPAVLDVAPDPSYHNALC